MVDFAILTLVATAVLSAYSASFKSIELAKSKIAAVALANEKMEDLRNLPYDELSTQHGAIYPPGDILDTEDVIRKGIRLTVRTLISYIDDPFDGNAEGTIVGKPTDIYPYDYKRIEVVVSRTGGYGELAKLSSNVAARAAETESNTGVIKICVIDASGQPVSGALVTIQNYEVEPPVNIVDVPADSSGCIMVPNLPPDSHNNYHVSATLTGYSTDSTSPRTAQNPNAIQPDLDIIVQQVTNQTLVIDRLSTFTIKVVDNGGNPVASTPIHVEGAKLLYFNPETPKYSHDFTTDAEGNVVIEHIEFDDYTITVPGWTISTTSPYQPVDLPGGVELTATVHVTHSTTSPTITAADPTEAITNTAIALKVTGDRFSDTSTLKIVNQLGQEIAGTNIIYDQHAGNKALQADFDLTSAPVGFWDIILTNSGGESVTQDDGLEITN